jgi:hypothetical protein
MHDLDGYHPVLDGEMNQLSAILNMERFHHLVFVKFDSARRDAERTGDLFG